MFRNLLCRPSGRTHIQSYSPSNYPSDKSISHRILMFAMLEKTTTVIHNVNISGAVTPLLEAMRALGVELELDGNRVTVGYINPAINHNGHLPWLNLGSSSAAARLLIGLLVGAGIEAVIDGDETLRPRPVDWVVDPLRELGANIEYLVAEGQLPVRIHRSTLRTGRVRLSVGSAQALSAVLYAAYAAQIDVEVEQKVRSRDHTQRLLVGLGGQIEQIDNCVIYRFGQPLSIHQYTVPVDPSAIVYPLTAHLLSGHAAPVVFQNVCLNETRTGFFELLKRAGAHIDYSSLHSYWGEPVGNLVLNPSPQLKGLVLNTEFDFHAMIDEVPLAILLATQIEGNSEFHGLAELTFKETNRITATKSMVEAFGASINIQNYSVHVSGIQTLHENSLIPCFGDHRLAMAASAVASGLGLSTTVIGGECFKTSFSNYVDCFHQLGFDLALTTENRKSVNQSKEVAVETIDG